MTLNHVELRKLHHVATLARVGSFVNAAEELHLTQSALTRSIQSIERRFGIRLFDRDRAGVHLTAVGREFLRRAEPLLLDAADLTRFLQRTGDGDAGEVAFGLSSLAARLFLPSLVAQIFATKPALRCSVAVRDPVELLQMLTTDKIEFLLAARVPDTPNVKLEVVDLVEVPSVLLVRLDHPLIGRGPLSLEEIAAFPIVISRFEPGAAAGIASSLPASLYCDDFGGLMQITQESDAIWLTAMPHGESGGASSGLATLPFSPLLDFPGPRLKSVTLARRTLSPTAEYVLAELQRRCEEIDDSSDRGT